MISNVVAVGDDDNTPSPHTGSCVHVFFYTHDYICYYTVVTVRDNDMYVKVSIGTHTHTTLIIFIDT